ncbi:MBL fold metallo-hydrolase [Nocardioides marmoriginsengisoli]|uniref:MBL fold metallo-hydrolase n=1 Tax=Nocardioides marmoriginsengisoli TaxID=661483 RepID=A0A3N0CH03_9ACTN|nr:MBL fold metallo-hydrolase [Nocardioides marmoriginsengisoli]RNL62720.1 MBL fold metallo-hydrolase [Nocardioides marmoriginsengisoli]
MTQLQYDLFVTPSVSQSSGTLNLPNGDPMEWSPTATTLIYGKHDAVLVDPPFTRATTAKMLAWVERTGRVITEIYITHGHGDHWLGAPVVLERFPDAVVRATAGTKALMADLDSAESREEFWGLLFPDQIPTAPVDVQVVGEEGLSLEGESLIPIEVGHTDSDDTTVLWVPSLKLAVAGDVVYNGVHLSLAESAGGGRDSWRQALDQVESLGAEYVVASHKDPTRRDDPADIGRTRRYLDDVDTQLPISATPLEFFEGMNRLHPERINPGVLWFGALTLLGGASTK